MKYLPSILLSFVTAFSLMAQTSSGSNGRLVKPTALTLLDSANIECIYSFKVYDPVLEETKEDLKILQLGTNFSKYFDYGAYQLDSIIAADHPNGLTQIDYRKHSIAYLPSWDAVIKNLSKSSMNVYERLPFLGHYVYEDGLNLMKWHIGNETTKVCNHVCRKATTTFRGRNWIVWFATDIPVDNGPWKFGGLPGLILKAVSSNNEQQFEAISIRTAATEIGVKNFMYQKTTREKFNLEERDSRIKPSQFHEGNPLVPKDENGESIISPYRRLFFNPIELE